MRIISHHIHGAEGRPSMMVEYSDGRVVRFNYDRRHRIVATIARQKLPVPAECQTIEEAAEAFRA